MRIKSIFLWTVFLFLTSCKSSSPSYELQDSQVSDRPDRKTFTADKKVFGEPVEKLLFTLRVDAEPPANAFYSPRTYWPVINPGEQVFMSSNENLLRQLGLDLSQKVRCHLMVTSFALQTSAKIVFQVIAKDQFFRGRSFEEYMVVISDPSNDRRQIGFLSYTYNSSRPPSLEQFQNHCGLKRMRQDSYPWSPPSVAEENFNSVLQAYKQSRLLKDEAARITKVD